MRTDRLVAGLDLGSTGIKMLVSTEAGSELLTAKVATPWRAGPAGTTEIDADTLVSTVLELIESVSERVAEIADSRIEAIAIAGMGETGVLIDESGSAVAPGFAWFDPRGAEEATSFPREVRAEFAGRTGLPLGAQVTAAKLAYLRGAGVRLSGRRWLNLPEFVARSLGGDAAVEYSLTSRTGLLDQDTDAPWPAIFDALDLDASFLPPLRDAGTSWGRATALSSPNIAGARLTVAGHDHLVAAEATGGLAADRYHVSMGTAEVLIRVVDSPLGYDTRARLAGRLINDVRHVVPGEHVLVAGVKTGLLLRRALQAAGINDRAGRDRLDAAVMALPYEGALEPGGIEAFGARNDDGVLRLAVRADGVSPAEVFAAILRHSNEEIARLIDAIDSELPPAKATTLTGGWATMASVQRARARVLPDITASRHEQETAFGAALVAMRLLEDAPAAMTALNPTQR